MDKETKIIITEEVKKRKLIKKHNHCYKKNTNLATIEQQILKAKEIIIYDVTETKEKIKKFNIKDHINKTGENPLRKTKPLVFLDICNLYTKEKQGIITTCLGKKYNKEKKHHPYPSTFISSIAILCKKINPKVKIKGILLNSV